MSRIAKEYQSVQKRLQSAQFSWVSSLTPVQDEDLSEWECSFWGPEGSPFHGYKLQLHLKVDLQRYPMSAPHVRFSANTVAHPNVKWATGEICLDLFKDAWTPVYTLLDVAAAVRDLLVYPGLDSPLDLDIAKLYSLDYEAYAQVVKYRLVEAGLGA